MNAPAPKTWEQLDIEAPDERWWLPWAPRSEYLRQARALWRQITTLRREIMTAADDLRARLAAATDEIAADITDLRDRLANAQNASQEEKDQAVADALAGFEAPISRLEAMGADPSDPVPSEPAPEPSSDGGDTPTDAA